MAGGLLLVPPAAGQAGSAQDAEEAQEAGPVGGTGASVRAASGVEPDTVRVGEPFRIGITVRAGPSVEVHFPSGIELGEGLEQRSPAQIRESGRDGLWRAHYEFVAWRTGRTRPATVTVPVSVAGREESVRVTPPSILVASVLPAEGEAGLRPARPFLERDGPPWAWIAAALLLAALSWWWWRRRRREAVAGAAAPGSPAERTLEALERLRADWEGGRVGDRAFFDRLESVLRRYGETTHRWSPAATLRSLANGDGDLAAVLKRSSLVRFARLTPGARGPRLAVEACEDWVRRDAGLRDGEVAERGVEERAASGPGGDG